MNSTAGSRQRIVLTETKRLHPLGGLACIQVARLFLSAASLRRLSAPSFDPRQGRLRELRSLRRGDLVAADHLDLGDVGETGSQIDRW